MSIARADIDSAPEVSSTEIRKALGPENPIIHTNDEAMRVADYVGVEVFRVGAIVFAPFDTKIN